MELCRNGRDGSWATSREFGISCGHWQNRDESGKRLCPDCFLGRLGWLWLRIFFCLSLGACVSNSVFPSSFLPQEGQCSKEHIKFRSLVLIPEDGVLETEKCFWDCNELCTSFTPVYALRHKRQTYHVELHNYNAALFIGDNIVV